MFRLNLIIDAPDDPSPHEVLVDRFPFQLGRALENDLSLPFASVSSRHLAIDLQGSHQILITDLGSTNGTRIDEELMAPHQPRSVFLPCRLRLGQVHISLEAANEEEVAFTLAQSGTELREMVDDVILQSDIDDDSKPFFEILSGPDSGRRFHLRLDGGPTILGTGRDAHIRLNLPHLPAVLGSINWDHARCCLTPEESLIQHQGQPLSGEHHLRSGDRFIIDAMELLYFDPLEKALESMECEASEMNDPDLLDAPEMPDEDVFDEEDSMADSKSSPEDNEEQSEPQRLKSSTEDLPEPDPRPSLADKSSPRPRLGLAEIALLIMSVIFLIGTIGLLWILL